MSAPLDRYKETLRKASITDDKPLFAALLTAYETALTAQQAVGNGARGLTEQGERELIDRVTEVAAESTEREVERLTLRFNVALALKAAALLFVFGILCFGGGVYADRQYQLDISRQVQAAFQDGQEAAKAWLTLMQGNDIRAALGRCTGQAVTVSGGRKACAVPLWLDQGRVSP